VAATLLPRTTERSLQPFSFLSPTVVLNSRVLLQNLNLGLDIRHLFRMLTLGLVQRRLRFVRCLLAPFAISFPGGLLTPALDLTALLLFLEFGSGPSGVRSLISGGGPFVGFARSPFRRRPFPADPRSVGRSECSANRPFDPAGRFSTTPGFDIVAATTSGSSASLATPRWERLLPAPLASSAAFIDGAAIARS